jgi:hypothetical protein
VRCSGSFQCHTHVIALLLQLFDLGQELDLFRLRHSVGFFELVVSFLDGLNVYPEVLTCFTSMSDFALTALSCLISCSSMNSFITIPSFIAKFFVYRETFDLAEVGSSCKSRNCSFVILSILFFCTPISFPNFRFWIQTCCAV